MLDLNSKTAAAGAAATPRLLALDTRHGWRQRQTPAGTLHVEGDPAAEAIVSALLAAGRIPPAVEWSRALAPIRGFWAVVLCGPSGVAAAVDHVRSTPLFYVDGPQGLVIGDDARAVVAAAGLGAVDPAGAEEFSLAAYTIGPRTLRLGLSQLVAGEAAVWPGSGKPSFARHHAYHPSSDDHAPPVSLRDHGEVMDAAIDRLIHKADGRPIWIPLSGGLDSRLVMAKLVERAYRPLSTFSYGPRGNSDAAIARLAAERLGVPWRFVSTSGEQIRAFINSEARRDYWRFADGLSALPSMQDVLPLAVLRETGVLPADAMIVNGNSGDFISGAHISPRILTGGPVTPRQLLDAIVDKHFALWKSILTPARRRAIADRIARSLDLDPDSPAMSPAAAASLYECHEYAERQSKFVVNGQRSYEWHGLSWHLPLWDRDIVELFARAPLSDRAGRSLYRRYCNDWDYRGVFSAVTQRVTAWPRTASMLLAPLAAGLRLAVGRERRDRMFRYLNYFDRFGDHYKAFGFREFARHAQDSRNPASFYVKVWLRENGVDIEELAGA